MFPGRTPGAGPPATPTLRLLIGPFETGGGDFAANPKAEAVVAVVRGCAGTAQIEPRCPTGRSNLPAAERVSISVCLLFPPRISTRLRPAAVLPLEGLCKPPRSAEEKW